VKPDFAGRSVRASFNSEQIGRSRANGLGLTPESAIHQPAGLENVVLLQWSMTCPLNAQAVVFDCPHGDEIRDKSE
jgi:hypothetical protein